MEKNEIYPILAVPAISDNNEMRFLLLDDQIVIKNDLSKIVWSILKFSNGYNSISDISNLTMLGEDIVNSIISQLITLKIMCDSRELYSHFHELSSAPDRFFRKLTYDDVVNYTESSRKPVKNGDKIEFTKKIETYLSKLIFERRSCRSFSNIHLNKDIIGNICMHGYSVNKHAVASGGGLYPLKIYVIVDVDQIDLNRGYYEYDSEKDLLIKYNDDVDLENLKYCFNDEIMPFNSQVQIVIAADLKRQTYKYSNRGYRLTLIEAGQVAQNISLFCQMENIGTCELGGVLDIPLAKELNIFDEEISPLLSIAIGFPSEDNCYNVYSQMNKIESEYVGENKPVVSYGGSSFNSDVSFFAAYAYYGDNKNECAGGTSTSYHGALLKAIVEAYERKISESGNFDFYCSAKDLIYNWIHPYAIKPLVKPQIEGLGLMAFSETIPIHWTKGCYITTNETVLIPSDLVYYGKKYCSDGLLFSDSSGVAAYTDYENAIKNALFELIERDAIMRNWYKKEIPSIIDDKFLPLHVKKQIAYWKDKNRNMYVLDMGSIFAPVIQVIIVGKEYPCFVCGASSGIENMESIVLKAMREAEYSLLQKMDDNRTEIRKENICCPEDHGRFYATEQNAENLSWLWSSKNRVNIPSSNFTYQQLLKILNPIIVDLSEKNSSIKVVRVLSEKCVPISFGINQDYYTHKEIDAIVSYDSLEPHYFD